MSGLRQTSYLLERAVTDTQYDKIVEFLETRMSSYRMSNSLVQFKDANRDLVLELTKEESKDTSENFTRIYIDIIRPGDLWPKHFFKPTYLEEILEFYGATSTDRKPRPELIEKFFPVSQIHKP